MQKRKEEQLDIFGSFKCDLGYMIPVRDEVLENVERVIELWRKHEKLSKEMISLKKPVDRDKFFTAARKMNEITDEINRTEQRIGHRIVSLIKECPF